jgi:hypothetical protein
MARLAPPTSDSSSSAGGAVHSGQVELVQFLHSILLRIHVVVVGCVVLCTVTVFLLMYKIF